MSGLVGSEIPLVVRHDLAILDLDGVVYVGADAVPGSVAALAEAASHGMARCFVTNNASRTPDSVAEHLSSLGVPATAAEVLTSAQVAAALLARRLAPGSKVLVVGGTGLQVALRAEGLAPVATMDEGPAAVVQGFSPTIDWALLAEGTRAVRAGLPWVASNLDATFPTVHGPAPGNGSLVQVIATASGKRPDAIAGKPAPEPFLEAARRYGSTRPLVVGDRLDTDIEGGCAAKIPSLVVLTGVSGAGDLLRAGVHERPSYIGVDLFALMQAHPSVELDEGPPRIGTRSRCRDTVVEVGGSSATEQLRVVAASGDPLDLLRAACALSWAVADADRPGATAIESGSVVRALGAATAAAWAR